MAEGPRMTAAQLADKLLQDEHADVLRESVAWMAAQLMNAEVSSRIGAELGEHSLERTTHRNGYRSATGTPGSAASSWPSPSSAKAPTSRRSWSRAGAPSRRWSRWSRRLMSPASRPGRSTGWWSRWPAPPGQGPGLAAVPRPGRAGPSLRGATLGGRLPVPVAGRQGGAGPRAGRGQAQGAGDRLRVHASGRRGAIGLAVGEAETEAFWRAFLRSLRERGLQG